MNADQRLLAWEFAAMSMEFTNKGRYPSNIGRVELLDKYNFIALPGMAKIHLQKEQKDARKARYYTYQTIKKIALSSKPTQAEIMTVEMLEGGRKPQPTDFLVAKLDQMPLRLRLKDRDM